MEYKASVIESPRLCCQGSVFNKMINKPYNCTVATIFLSVCAIILNVAMLWLVWIKNKLEGRFRIMLINLGIIDILFIIGTLLRVSVPGSDGHTYVLILTRSFFKYIRWVRFLTLAWITIERALAVFKALEYKTKYSYYSLYKIVGCLWAIPLLYVVIAGIVKSKNYPRRKVFIVICLNAVFLVILSCINMAVPIGIRKTPKISPSLPMQTSEARQQVRQARRNRERKPALLIFCLVSTYIISNTIAIIAQILHNTTLPVIVASCNMKQPGLLTATHFIVIIDIILDPMLYFFFNHVIKKYSSKQTPLSKPLALDKISAVKNASFEACKLRRIPEEAGTPIASVDEMDTVSKLVSNGELLLPTVRCQAFETDEIIVHAKRSQTKHINVEENVKVNEDRNCGDSRRSSNCSPCRPTESEKLPVIWDDGRESEEHFLSNIYNAQNII